MPELVITELSTEERALYEEIAQRLGVTAEEAFQIALLKALEREPEPKFPIKGNVVFLGETSS